MAIYCSFSVSAIDVDRLTGNLPEVNRWQQAFFKSLEECAKLPVPQQNMGTIFLKKSQEVSFHCEFISLQYS